MKSKLFNKKIFIILIITICTIITIYFLNLRNNIVFLSKYYKTIDLTPTNTIYLDRLGEGDFTCTGITYSNDRNTFFIADYGTINAKEIPKPRIIEVDKEFSKINSIIELKEITTEINLQGIAYENENKTLWIASGNQIYNINLNGKILSIIDLAEYSKYSANGISLDEENKKIFVLCYNKYLLEFDFNGNIIKKTYMNYKNQDHIFTTDDYLYVTIGADYKQNNNFLLKYSLIDQNIKLFRLNNSYSIEGCIIVDNKLYIVNDGKYHLDKNNKSYINIYDIQDIL